MVEYKSIEELLEKSREVLNEMSLTKAERSFLNKLELGAREYAKDPDGEYKVELFYERICDKGYSSIINIIEDGASVMKQASCYPHLKERVLMINSTARRLIKKRAKSSPHSVASNLHFMQSMRNDRPFF